RRSCGGSIAAPPLSRLAHLAIGGLMTRRGRVLQGALLSTFAAGGLMLAARPAAADHCHHRRAEVVVTREYYPARYYAPVRIYDPCDDDYVRVRRFER